MGLVRRLLFAGIGLVAGDPALLIVLLCNALRLRTVLLNAHIGAPNLALPNAMEIFPIYAIFSVIGWIFVGVPIVVALPERLLSRVPWLGCTLIGATLGPLALLIILLVLFAYQGRLIGFSLAHTEGLWHLSVIVSTVSFLVYTALLRRR
jgi:hypothetical protein